MLKEINLTELEQQISVISKPILLKFTAEWCPGCRQLAPVVESVSEQFGNQIVFFDVNVDKEIDLAKKVWCDEYTDTGIIEKRKRS
ncbi:thioredoxin family protein [Bacillus pacificus]